MPPLWNAGFCISFRFEDLRFPPARLRHRLESRADMEFALTVEAETFAWGVWLDAPEGVWVEDNYFDLLPGEAKTIAVCGPEKTVREITITAVNT